MTITYPIVKNIFDTLPVGYYLGRNINITLSETSDVSAFYPFEDKIVISYPTIFAATSEMTHIDETNLESIIRGLFYHEISHVIFTPNTLYDFYKGNKSHDILNIFEDERIETLCRDVYMNVDFKRTLLVMVGLHQPKNDIHAFFNLVRFRIGKSIWTNRVNEIINEHNRVNATSTPTEIQAYTTDVINLFNDFTADMKKKAKEDNNGEDSDENADNNSSDDNTKSKSDNSDDKNMNISTSGSSNNEFNDESDDDFSESNTSKDADESNEGKSSNSTNSSNSNNSNSNPDGETSEENNQPDAQSADAEKPQQPNVPNLEELLNSIKEKMTSTKAFTKKDLKHEANKLFNIYFNEELNARLTNIIYEKVKKNRQTGSAINSYSGRLNPRSVGTRDDYRWWTQQNRQGHIKQYSKVHFNLFIDNSGSFYPNDRHMNEFIQTLDRISIENTDFTFDVITINMNVVEWPDHHQRFHSTDGNRLLHSIADVIRRHQKPACNNYNIVLFDGDAHSDDVYYSKNAITASDEPFKHFDTNNTIIISDQYNKVYIDRANMKNATVRYCKSYCNMFIGVICDLLERAI